MMKNILIRWSKKRETTTVYNKELFLKHKNKPPSNCFKGGLFLSVVIFLLS